MKLYGNDVCMVIMKLLSAVCYSGFVERLKAVRKRLALLYAQAANATYHASKAS